MTRKGTHHPIQAAIEDVYVAGHTPRLQIDARRKDVEVPESVRRSWQARLVIDLDPSYPLELEYDARGLSVDLAFQGQVSRCRFAWRAIYAVIDRSTGRGIVVEAHLPPPELPPEDAWVDRQKKPRLSAIPGARASEPRSDRPNEARPDESRADESRTDESRTGESRTGESRTGESRTTGAPARTPSQGPRSIVPFAERLPSIPPAALVPLSVAPPPSGPASAGAPPSIAPLPEPMSSPSTPPAGARSEAQPSPSVAPGGSSDEAAKERRARFRVIDGGR